MRPGIILLFLLVVTMAVAGCVQTGQADGSCGGDPPVMTYVQHSYLWGDDGLMTRRYDVSIGGPGVPSIKKTGVSGSDFATYNETYCSPRAILARVATPAPVVITTAPTPQPSPTPIPPRRVTDGFWCRETAINIGKAPTDVTECYRFFPDGTYQWGFSPGRPMGKSPSCSGSPLEKCIYSINDRGQYQVEGGYSYNLTGDYLIDPHDPPYFMYRPVGIP